LTRALRCFDFVCEGNGKVLERDAAALIVQQQVILTEPELSRALAGLEQIRWRQEGLSRFFSARNRFSWFILLREL
jgi:hypothetical protein